MIRVLRERGEVEAALAALEREGLPVHVTPEKNWDHALIRELFEDLPRSARIVDMGSGDGHTLDFLHRLGFHDLTGIDLAIPRRRRLRRLLRAPWSRRFVATDRIERGDLCDTRLPAASVDAITCVSVIEHGVDTGRFLAECARILRPGGLLFVSTDYWEGEVAPGAPQERLFSLEWTIQDRARIEAMLEAARRVGLGPIREDEEEVPACGERTVRYLGREYTFIALGMARVGSRAASGEGEAEAGCGKSAEAERCSSP